MAIVCVSGACSRSGKTALAVSLLRALGRGAAAAVKFTTTEDVFERCPRGTPCVVCDIDVPFRIVEDPAVLDEAGTDTQRLGEAGAARVVWAIARESAVQLAWAAVRARLANHPLLVMEGSTIVGTAQPDLVAFVVHPFLSPERWKPGSAGLIARSDVVVVNRPRDEARPPSDAVMGAIEKARPRGPVVVGDATRELALWAPALSERLHAVALSPPAVAAGEARVTERRRLSLAHSPDSDDAFMFYGLASGNVPSGDVELEHVLCDIETLNRAAREGVHDVTAISFHAYPSVADKYALMPCGGSIGDGYGPLVVARQPLAPEDIARHEVAVPGLLTTAYLALRLFAPEVRTRVVPFDRILDEVREGRAEAGLIIHEGQLTYGGQGLHRVLDLGEWWKRETGLPLPLGGNAVRRALGPELMRALTRLVRETVRFSLAHRQDALRYAMSFARGMETGVADRFVGMWVNDMTVDCGEVGRRAVQTLLDRGHEAGVIPTRAQVDFVDA